MASRARAFVTALWAGALVAACNPARDPAPLVPEIPSAPPTSPDSLEPGGGGGAPALPLEPPPTDAPAPEPSVTTGTPDPGPRADGGVDAGTRAPVDAGRAHDAGVPVDAARRAAVDAARPVDAGVPLLPDAMPRPTDAGLLRPDANQPLL